MLPGGYGYCDYSYFTGDETEAGQVKRFIQGQWQWTWGGFQAAWPCSGPLDTLPLGKGPWCPCLLPSAVPLAPFVPSLTVPGTARHDWLRREPLIFCYIGVSFVSWGRPLSFWVSGKPGTG